VPEAKSGSGLIPEPPTQAEVDKQMRIAALDVARMPWGALMAITPETLDEMPAYKAMWVRVIRKASGDKPDLRAAEFVQEHLAGKAVQRVQSQQVVLTYQNVLDKVKEAEKRYQGAVNNPVMVDVEVTEVQPDLAAEWAALMGHSE